MRKWRTENPPSEEQRLKSNARSYANCYVRRGKLDRKPCVRCNSAEAEKHHPDYTKPLEVVWLCRPCHLLEHSTKMLHVEHIEKS